MLLMTCAALVSLNTDEGARRGAATWSAVWGGGGRSRNQHKPITRQRCVFLHGVGSVDDEAPTSTFEE